MQHKTVTRTDACLRSDRSVTWLPDIYVICVSYFPLNFYFGGLKLRRHLFFASIAKFIDTLNNHRQQDLSAVANSSSVNQDVIRVLWKPKLYYRVHKSPPLLPVPSQTIHCTPSHHISLRAISTLSYLRKIFKVVCSCMYHLSHTCYTLR